MLAGTKKISIHVVTNILEGLGLIEKRKNQVSWR